MVALGEMRGRLIFPFVVQLAQLDTAATDADPDGAGPLESGYDDVFREPIRVPDVSDAQLGVSARQETELRVRAQIEPQVMEALQMFAGGDSRRNDFAVVLHFTELEARGLLDPNGLPLIRINDRMTALRRADASETLIFNVPEPGLFVVEMTPIGVGLGGHRNLLHVRFRDREQGVRK